MDGIDETPFQLGEVRLVCRWRLSGRRLPLLNRHVRALSQRTVDGARPTPELCAWVRTHVEGTLGEGAQGEPDGVLMVVVDEKGRSAMSVGPYAPLADATLAALIDRARRSRAEAESTGVAPETLWVMEGDRPVVAMDLGEAPAGATGLAMDLLTTKAMTPRAETDLLDRLTRGEVRATEAFLVSDEHGVVAASDLTGPVSSSLAAGLERLRAVEADRRRPGRF